MVVNIDGGDVTDDGFTGGDIILDYIGALPPELSAHRYLIMVHEQEKAITAGDLNTDREFFDYNSPVTGFVETHGLTAITLNQIDVAEDAYVASVYEKDALQDVCDYPNIRNSSKRETISGHEDQPYALSISFSSPPGQTITLDGENYTFEKTTFEVPESGVYGTSAWYTQNQPDVHWTPQTDKRYTLMLIDPDGSNCGTETGQYLHWMVVNIDGDKWTTSSTDNDNVLAPWQQPAPPELRAHRYMFLLHEQTHLLDVTQLRNEYKFDALLPTGRQHFDYSTPIQGTGFIYKYGLRAVDQRHVAISGDAFAAMVTAAVFNYNAVTPVAPSMSFVPPACTIVQSEKEMIVQFSTDAGSVLLGDHVSSFSATEFTLPDLPVYSTSGYYTQNMPAVTWTQLVTTSTKWTLLMVDFDAAHCGSGAAFVHWMVVNIDPGVGVLSSDVGDHVAPYFAPAVQELYPHRYNLIMHEQTEGEIDTAPLLAAYANIEGRAFFDYNSPGSGFVATHSLKPVIQKQIDVVEDTFVVLALNQVSLIQSIALKDPSIALNLDTLQESCAYLLAPPIQCPALLFGLGCEQGGGSACFDCATSNRADLDAVDCFSNRMSWVEAYCYPEHFYPPNSPPAPPSSRSSSDDSSALSHGATVAIIVVCSCISAIGIIGAAVYLRLSRSSQDKATYSTLTSDLL